MGTSSQFDERRYLLAKRTVDDRALHRGALEAFGAALCGLASPRPRVLELGAGVGTMVTRLRRWGVLERAHYTLLDRDAASLEAAADQLLAEHPGAVRRSDGTLELGEQLAVELRHGELPGWLDGAGSAARFDAVMGNAVLDLLDVPALLPRLWRALGPRSPYWFSINFDGETILLPQLPMDDAIMALYHRSMDQRLRDGRPSGDSRCGRHLLEQLPESGASVDAAGGSDWVVIPDDAGYPHDEAYFLHHIVRTIELELRAHPELDGEAFAAWVAQRRAQIGRAELRYVAHQLDVAGRAPG